MFCTCSIWKSTQAIKCFSAQLYFECRLEDVQSVNDNVVQIQTLWYKPTSSNIGANNYNFRITNSGSLSCISNICQSWAIEIWNKIDRSITSDTVYSATENPRSLFTMHATRLSPALCAHSSRPIKHTVISFLNEWKMCWRTSTPFTAQTFSTMTSV